MHGMEIDETISESDTEFHEAAHTLAAILLGIGVSHVTNVPTSEYQGATFTTRWNAIVAAAAESQECNGTGHDMMQVRAHGENPGWAVSAARSLLAGRRRELLAIATLLKKRNTISGGESRDAANSARDGLLFEVVVTRLDGKAERRIVSVLDSDDDILVAADLPTESSVRPAERR